MGRIETWAFSDGGGHGASGMKACNAGHLNFLILLLGSWPFARPKLVNDEDMESKSPRPGMSSTKRRLRDGPDDGPDIIQVHMH